MEIKEEEKEILDRDTTFKNSRNSNELIDKILKSFNSKSNIKINKSIFIRVCLKKVLRELNENKITPRELIFNGLINSKMEKY